MSTHPHTSPRRGGLLTANATVFVSSACIMVVELVAGRLVSRFIGQSLYTWTAIIGVVLAGISIGNALGGRLADRVRPLRSLGLLFLAAGAGCLAMLGLNELAGNLQALWGLPWPLRVFLHVGLAFLLPSIALGTISPNVAKMALARGYATGQTIGAVYAWAVLGSLVGVFVTGFWLLAHMGARCVVWSMAGVLGGLGLIYLVWALLQRESIAGGASPGEATPARARETTPSRWAWWLPMFTVFTASACLMAVEIVAGRLASRQFGQSLYTWTNVIGVILAGISLGNYVGGILADLRPARGLLAALCGLSALLCVAGAAIHEGLGDVLALTVLPWPVHIFVHVMAAFFLPAASLGAVTPAVAKMTLELGRGQGRTVGMVYAWNSIGSILGTFVAGYALVAMLGPVGVLCVVALLLSVMAVAFARRRALALACLALSLVATAGTFWPGQSGYALGRSLLLRARFDPRIVYEDESAYSYIKISAELNQPNVRAMYLDKLMHSQVDLNNPFTLLYDYEWVYEAAMENIAPAHQAISALVIGGGGYTFPHYLEASRPGSQIQVAEIDPAVTEAAHAAFGLPRSSTVEAFNLDARNHLADLARRKAQGAPAKLQFVFGDSINDYTVPYHLTTEEVDRQIYDLLSEDGVYMLNLIDTFASGQFLGAVINTCRRVFPQVYVFNTIDRAAERDTFIVISAKQPLDLAATVARIQAHHKFTGRLLTPEELDDVAHRSGIVLTDDFAPVENLLAPVVHTRRQHREELYLYAAIDRLACNELDSAERLCRRALEVRPHYPEAHEALGVIVNERGDHDGAIAEWKRALALNPASELAWYDIGIAYEAKQDLPQAIEAFRQAIAIRPSYDRARYRLGAMLTANGQCDEAVALWQEVTQANPDSAEAFLNLGLAYEGRNECASAVEAWKKALALDPNSVDALTNLALACARLGDLAASKDAATRAIAQGGQFPKDFLEAIEMAPSPPTQ